MKSSSGQQPHQHRKCVGTVSSSSCTSLHVCGDCAPGETMVGCGSSPFPRSLKLGAAPVQALRQSQHTYDVPLLLPSRARPVHVVVAVKGLAINLSHW